MDTLFTINRRRQRNTYQFTVPLGEITPALASPIYIITSRIVFIKEHSQCKQRSLYLFNTEKSILALLYGSI